MYVPVLWGRCPEHFAAPAGGELQQERTLAAHHPTFDPPGAGSAENGFHFMATVSPLFRSPGGMYVYNIYTKDKRLSPGTEWIWGQPEGLQQWGGMQRGRPDVLVPEDKNDPNFNRGIPLSGIMPSRGNHFCSSKQERQQRGRGQGSADGSGGCSALSWG